MARESREHWAKRVERWTDSGLTAGEFARELGISASSLKWWKWRLGSAAAAKPASSPAPRVRSSAVTKAPAATSVTFVEVSAPRVAEAPLELVLPSALVVRVRAGFDDVTLGRLLDVLARRR